jgi:hypothetical protein
MRGGGGNRQFGGGPNKVRSCFPPPFESNLSDLRRNSARNSTTSREDRDNLRRSSSRSSCKIRGRTSSRRTERQGRTRPDETTPSSSTFSLNSPQNPSPSLTHTVDPAICHTLAPHSVPSAAFTPYRCTTIAPPSRSSFSHSLVHVPSTPQYPVVTLLLRLAISGPLISQIWARTRRMRARCERTGKTKIKTAKPSMHTLLPSVKLYTASPHLDHPSSNVLPHAGAPPGKPANGPSGAFGSFLTLQYTSPRIPSATARFRRTETGSLDSSG